MANVTIVLDLDDAKEVYAVLAYMNSDSQAFFDLVRQLGEAIALNSGDLPGHQVGHPWEARSDYDGPLTNIKVPNGSDVQASPLNISGTKTNAIASDRVVGDGLRLQMCHVCYRNPAVPGELFCSGCA